MRSAPSKFVWLAALGLALVLVAAAAAAGPPRFVVPDLSPGGGGLPQDLAVGDFTDDGNQDVAVANLGPDAFNGGVTVLPGDGAGNLGTPIETDLGIQQGALDISNAVDFDADGKLDLAVQAGTTGGPGADLRSARERRRPVHARPAALGRPGARRGRRPHRRRQGRPRLRLPQRGGNRAPVPW